MESLRQKGKEKKREKEIGETEIRRMLIFRDRSLSVSRQSARFEILGEYQRLLDISDDGISHLSSTGLVLTSRSGR